MIKVTLFFVFMVVSFFSGVAHADVQWAQGPRPVMHQFVGDETVWFLSSVYYGSAKKYERILMANGIQKPEKIKNGQWLIIPNARFSPWKKGGVEKQTQRYTQLYQDRAAVFAARALIKDQSEIVAKVHEPESKKEARAPASVTHD